MENMCSTQHRLAGFASFFLRETASLFLESTSLSPRFAGATRDAGDLRCGHISFLTSVISILLHLLAVLVTRLRCHGGRCVASQASHTSTLYHSAYLRARMKFAGVIVIRLRCHISPPSRGIPGGLELFQRTIRTKVSSDPVSSGGCGGGYDGSIGEA